MSFGKAQPRTNRPAAPTVETPSSPQAPPKARAIWFFVAAAVVYGLQLFPPVGVILMMMMAPFWSVILINVGFLLLAVESQTGASPRWVVIFPILYFGGYLGLAGASHFELARVKRDVAQFNANVRVDFDPARQALVIADSATPSFALVERYGLPVVWTPNSNFVTAQYLSERFVDRPTCDRIEASGLRSEGVVITGPRQRPCHLRRAENPVLPLVEVHRRELTVRNWLLPYVIEEFAITAPGQPEKRVRAGYAAPLPWVPTPVLGCALNSGAPAWECTTQFMRQVRARLVDSKDKGKSEAAVLAAALGLRAQPPAMRAAADAEVEAQLIRDRAELLEDERSRLAQIVAAPSAPHENEKFYQFDLLRRDGALAADMASSMADALPRALEAGGRSAPVLAMLIEQLPDREFRSVAPRLLKAVGDDDKSGRGFRESFPLLTARLGDAGSIGLPTFIADIVPTERRPSYAAILALCRMGPAAAVAVPRLIEILRTEDRQMRNKVHSAAYVALLRLGHRAEALAGQQSDVSWRKDWYAAQAATVTPASSPDVCTNADRAPRYPSR